MVRVFAGPNHAARELSVVRQNISKCILGTHRIKSVGNCTWQYIENPVKEDEARARRKKLEIELSTMKHVEHLPIDIELPKPYIAGFVDGDGHVETNAFNGQSHSVSQKYVAICEALKREYGGSIWRDGTTGVYKWTLMYKRKILLGRDRPIPHRKKEAG